MTDHPPRPDRRTFVSSASAALAAAALGPTLARPRARPFGPGDVDVRIDVLTNELIGPVTGHHYGHFVEHLGAVIYDGVWVGEKSPVPNYQGLRKAVVDDLKALTPGVVR